LRRSTIPAAEFQDRVCHHPGHENGFDVGLTAYSAKMSNNYKIKPIGYEIAQFAIARNYIRHHAFASAE
jgi:hypothetical protein